MNEIQAISQLPPDSESAISITNAEFTWNKVFSIVIRNIFNKS